jgi:hypothetical protein
MEKNRWVREWSCRRIFSTKETMGVGSRVLAGLSAVLPKCDEEEGCSSGMTWLREIAGK